MNWSRENPSRPEPDIRKAPLMAYNSSAFPECIETDRLTLRPPVVADATAMFASYTQDADVARYMVWRPHASLEATRDFVTGCVNQWTAGSAFPYVITMKPNGQLIGMLEARLDRHIVNIGYVLTRSHWGQGLMAEAIQAFTDYALSLTEVFRVEATCDVDNRPSARALEKSGFLLEGRLARHTVHPNICAEPRDCFVYAACRP
jgi:[ribosomal protein S5]-alanine N-acetyltransferase